MNPNELAPEAQLMQFVLGKWIAKPIHAVAELGITDMLEDGPRSIKYLAEKTQTHAPYLYRIMRALASVGIFRETQIRVFELTPMASCLKTGVLRSTVQMFHADWNEKAWACLMKGLQQGETPFELAHGMPLFEWLEAHPHDEKLLMEANATRAEASIRALLGAYEFSSIQKLVDVGGGEGRFLAAILEANPHMTGTLVELPGIVKKAEAYIATKGLQNRCIVKPCSFLEQILAKGDACLLSNVLHDWPDSLCLSVLENCRAVLSEKGRLLIMEMLVPPENQPGVSKLLDLEMMVVTGGMERTESEFRFLLEQAGFSLIRTIPTGGDFSILEASPKI